MTAAIQRVILMTLSIAISVSAYSDESVVHDPIPLWPGVAPHATGDGVNDTPTLTPYLPSGNPTGTAVVVCPGGGYGGLAMDHEGDAIGRWLNGHGIAAFVLTYRHAPKYQHPVPRMDVRRALQYVRANAGKWSLSPDRIGIMGFSAGGHLTGTAATQFAKGNPAAEDPVSRVTSRPDFAIMVYPVVTLKPPFAHMGSRKNLLGRNAPDTLVNGMSLETQVTAETPPVFLVHTSEDRAVPAENSVHFYLALREAGVPAELHIFEKGRHGLGLGDGMAFGAWPELCMTWLTGLGLLEEN